MEDLKQKALELYKPPFRHDPLSGWIWDANHEHVADKAGEEDIVRIRGWGRIQYLPNPEKLQDTVGEIVAEALNEYWQRRTQPAVSAEPVGWLMKSKRGIYLRFIENKDDAALAADVQDWATITPLYAHPPAPAVAWQPIETAPKDVERLLVWCETDDGGDVFLLHQNKRGQWLYDGQPLYALPFWMEAKYWMPLPTPPNGGAA